MAASVPFASEATAKDGSSGSSSNSGSSGSSGSGSNSGSGNSGHGGGDDHSGHGGGGDDDGGGNDDDHGGSSSRGGGSGFGRSDYDSARDAVRDGRILPLKSVLQKIDTSRYGRVIDISLNRTLFSDVYQLKLLDSKGTIRTLRVDARSGAVIGGN